MRPASRCWTPSRHSSATTQSAAGRHRSFPFLQSLLSSFPFSSFFFPFFFFLLSLFLLSLSLSFFLLSSFFPFPSLFLLFLCLSLVLPRGRNTGCYPHDDRHQPHEGTADLSPQHADRDEACLRVERCLSPSNPSFQTRPSLRHGTERASKRRCTPSVGTSRCPPSSRPRRFQLVE